MTSNHLLARNILRCILLQQRLIRRLRKLMWPIHSHEPNNSLFNAMRVDAKMLEVWRTSQFIADCKPFDFIGSNDWESERGTPCGRYRSVLDTNTLRPSWEGI
jgi:hypothetical protein